MAAKKFIVELDTQERARLSALISKGKATAKVILKARILLKADRAEGGPGWLDDQILKALDTNLTMVSRTREKFVTEGLDAVLTRKRRETPPTPAIFDGEAQAKLTALACSEPPPGHAGLAQFDDWVRQDPIGRDDTLRLPDGEKGNMHDTYAINANTLALRYNPEDLLISPDPQPMLP